MTDKLSWRALNSKISEMSEQELLGLMDAELEGAKRTTVLVRLHQRYTMVRCTRERDDMLRKLDTTPAAEHCLT
jgi:hypothetical protein